MTGFSLCVYCGSRMGSDASYAQAAQALGAAIGQRGWQLVYGGGRVGLMGTLADAAKGAGARTVGIIPDSLVRREVSHTGLDELHVVHTMHERKQAMASRADAFLALPGGLGTFEELYEVWTWRHLAYHHKPIGLLNVAGYYDRMLAFLQHAREQDFVGEEQHRVLLVDDEIDRLLDRIASDALGPASEQDLSRI